MKKISKKAKEVEKHFFDNDSEILKSDKCTCLSCLKTYDAKEVSEWVSYGEATAAVCPKCGSESVIGDASGIAFADMDEKLAISEELYGKGFGPAKIDNAKKFIYHYKNKEIAHSKYNEMLYLANLRNLARINDADACYTLGEFYAYDSPYTKHSYAKAIKFLTRPCLSTNPSALDKLGEIYQAKKQYAEAFVCYSKAMSFGSAMGFIHYNDCFNDGMFVKKDTSFALNSYLGAFSDAIAKFVRSEGRCVSVLPEACVRVFSTVAMAAPSKPVNADMVRTFLLIALFSLDSLSEVERDEPNVRELLDFCKKSYKTFYEKEWDDNDVEPLYDTMTFVDSLINANALPFVYQGSAKIVSADLDKSTDTMTLTIDYPHLPLIIDVDNGYCGFGPKRITWTFEKVESLEFKEGANFNYVNMGPDFSGASFIYDDGKGEEKTVLTYKEFELSSEEMEDFEKIKKAGMA